MSHHLLINGAQSHTRISILTSRSSDSHLSDKEKANLYLSLTHKHPVCVCVCVGVREQRCAYFMYAYGKLLR